MVSFRLTTDEYAQSLLVCRATGYSSMSRFALGAMRSFIPVQPEQQAEFNHDISQMADLQRRVDELTAEVKLLAETVRRER